VTDSDRLAHVPFPGAEDLDIQVEPSVEAAKLMEAAGASSLMVRLTGGHDRHETDDAAELPEQPRKAAAI
jgi:hypothetical protein